MFLTKHLFSNHWMRSILMGLAFGSIAFLIVFYQITIPIPGTNTHSDPREIFTILGSALGGFPAGIVIGFLAGAPTSATTRFASIFAHLLSAFFIAFVYNYFLSSLKSKFLILFWIFLIPINFIFVLAPAYILGLILFYQQQVNFFPLLGTIITGARIEILYTTLFTTAVMGALPAKLRKPIFKS